MLSKNNVLLSQIPTPSYIVDESLLLANAEIIAAVRKKTGCKILLALKAFSMFSTFPLLRKYLDGTCASSLNELRLGAEEFGKEAHIFSPAFTEKEFPEILKYADHISFNSFAQWQRFRKMLGNSKKKISAGMRVNPEHREVDVALYDPCAPFSRLGVTLKEFEKQNQEGLEGLHVHNLCQKNADALERTWEVFEKKFGKYLAAMKWLNLGGGHHITRKDYDLDRLCALIKKIKAKYKLEIYLEPGEAVALNAGFLVASVVDIVKNKKEIAILDASAATHMPDVLEMPYRPEIIGAGKENEKKYNYRLGGPSCLAGDVIGDYAFAEPLEIGQTLIFTDMAIYAMVKNTTFNGINLPSIGIITQNKKFTLIKEFGYEDFKNRLS